MRRFISIRQTLRGAVALTAVMTVAGCAALSGQEATSDTYRLVAPAIDDASTVRRGTQILIAEPSALKDLDSQSIVVRPDALTIQYLEASQWSDRLPRLVQKRLEETFDKTGRFDGIGLPGQGLAIDFQIVTDIREFAIDAADGRARVEIGVKLLNDTNGVVRATRTFSAQAAVSPASGAPALVAALNRAFAEVASDIVRWTADRI